MQILCHLNFGSHLYGTNTPSSDLDIRTIFWPSAIRTMIGDPETAHKLKLHEDGSVAGVNDPMGAGCVEEEFIPVQDFFRGVAVGECKAVETFFAIIGGRTTFVDAMFHDLCLNFYESFKDKLPHSGMVGFAKKSTMDYVHRANRLHNIEKILKFFTDNGFTTSSNLRLDSQFGNGTIFSTFKEEVLRNFEQYEEVSFTTCKVSNSASNNLELEAIQIAGRTIMDRTPIKSVLELLNGIVKDYGRRVKTIENNSIVEWKSIAHAVRSYRQAIELNETHNITFPRPDTQFLIDVKTGKVDAQAVLDVLAELDAKLDTFKEKPPIVLKEHEPYVKYMVEMTRRDTDAYFGLQANLNLS
jgi:hypothetical protein